MDSKNFTIFMVLVIAMMTLVTLNLQGQGISFSERGKPVVRGPFTNEEYNISLEDDRIIVYVSDEVAKEYEGQYLSVYAYDEEGRHFAIFKRVIDKKITITGDETPNFQVTFEGNKVMSIEKPTGAETFHEILKDSLEENRNHGLERCILGRQCVRTCPVKAVSLIRDDSPEGRGRVIPEIDYGKCILDGRCPTVCPTHIITFDKG